MVSFPARVVRPVVNVVWLFCVALALSIFVAAFPTGYALRLSGALIGPAIDAPAAYVALVSVGNALLSILVALVSFAVATILFWKRRDEPMALFVSFLLLAHGLTNGGVLEALNGYLRYFPGSPEVEGALLSADFLSMAQTAVLLAPIPLFLYLFPNARFVPGWTRAPGLFSLVIALPVILAAASIPSLGWATIVLFAVYFSLTGVGFYAQVFRYRHASTHVERQQIRLVVLGVLLAVLMLFIVGVPYIVRFSIPPGLAHPWWTPLDELGWWLAMMILPVSLGVAVMRYRLWDISLILNRTLVYGTLSAGIIVTYILIVGVFGALLNSNANLAAAIATAALTALLFSPARARLQRAVPSTEQRGEPVPSPVRHAGERHASAAMPLTRRLPWLLFALTCAFSALGLVLLALSWATPVPDAWGFRGDGAIMALAFSGVGQLLARHRPQNPIGWLFLVAGLVAAIVEFWIEYAAYALLTQQGALPGGVLAAWAASWLWFVWIGALVYVFLIFPTGRLPSKRWRPVGWGIVGTYALNTVALMFRPGPLWFARYLDNPFANNELAANWLAQIVGPALGLCTLLVGVSIVQRLRRAECIERQQLKWFAYAAALISVIGIIDIVGSSVRPVGGGPKLFQLFTFAVWIVVAFTVGLAILRYRLWDIDLIIHRTLVFGALTAGIIALYIILVGALGALSQTSGNLLISLVATGLIAFLFQPLREWLQRGVNRLLYGERDEPYAVISRLGQHLETADAPDSMLGILVSTIAQALKLPYVAIEIDRSGKAEIAAEYGHSSSHLQRIPLPYQGEIIGQLLVAPRGADEPLSPPDLNLLRIIAQQAGMAVHAAQLTEDLQRSRERLVVAREEERRRIRRDLHDGLGPALASLAMEADNARDWTDAAPDKTKAALAEITTKAQDALQDIRRLVYDLRPPALDELGLVGALRQSAANSPNGLHIEIVAPEPFPPLSAAVEVAAYRIAQETLNNVARHSHARHCSVRISIQDEFRLEICDDGVGVPPDARSGVGMISVRERAAELGGTCVVESIDGSGTRVTARMPLARNSPEDG